MTNILISDYRTMSDFENWEALLRSSLVKPSLMQHAFAQFRKILLDFKSLDYMISIWFNSNSILNIYAILSIHYEYLYSYFNIQLLLSNVQFTYYILFLSVFFVKILLSWTKKTKRNRNQCNHIYYRDILYYEYNKLLPNQ